MGCLMQSMEKIHSHSEGGSGILIVAKELSLSRSSQHYDSDYHHNSSLFERYIDTLKDLRKLQGISTWMSENRSVWNWIEQYLQTDLVQVSHHQLRGDYHSRGEVGVVQLAPGALTHHNQSDSDANIGGNDSDDEDEESRYEAGDSYSSGKIIVSGAGLVTVNGVYNYNGAFDTVARYSKSGIWKNREETFSLFRCRLSDNTKRWYISIVPKNIQPGTNKDTDFYLATATGDQSELPDSVTWMTAKEGTEPAPAVTYKCDPISDSGEDPIDQTEQISGEDHQHTADTVEDDENMCYM